MGKSLHGKTKKNQRFYIDEAYQPHADHRLME